MFKNILITQSQMKNYSGSEIVSLELIEYFSEIGSHVTLLTNYIDYPIKKDLNSIPNLTVIKLGTKEANCLNIEEFDLVWIHHLTLNDTLIEQLYDKNKRNKVKVVFHHMSSRESMEFPVAIKAEKELADTILFNAPGTVVNFKKKGIDFSDSNIKVFGNPAPDSFLAKGPKERGQEREARSIGVISNHPTDEMRSAAEILTNSGVKVDFIGRTGNRYERVTPELLDQYDIIVSIGKTVQYCILNNKPVYCYDRFGGPGFLSENNYTSAMNRNFSGRGFDYKTVAEIVSDLSGELNSVLAQSTILHNKYAKDFLLSDKIKLICKELRAVKNAKERTDEGKNILINYSANINKYFPAYLDYQYKYKKINQELDRLNELNRKLDIRSRQLEAIVTSWPYKIAKIISLPLRATMKIARRGKEKVSSVRRAYILYNTPNINTVAVGGLLYRFYGVRRSYSGPRIAVVVRGMHTRPTSSAWIRLFSPLTYGKSKYRLSFHSSVDELNMKSIDVCIIQRTAIDSAEEVSKFLDSARNNNTRTIVDVDDAFIDLDKAHPQYQEQKRWVEALEELVKNADELWVSTPEIAKRFKRDSKVLANSIDNRIWKVKKENILSGEKIKILYMGTGTHHEDFKMILSDLDRLNSKYNNVVELTLIGVGSGLPEREWLIKKPIPERNTIYPLFVKWLLRQGQYDIGIAPLVNSAFNRAKSDIKVLDYLCCGVIPVVSDIEPYRNTELDEFVIRVGYKKGAWFDALEDIILNKEEYSRQKKSGIENIERFITEERSVGRMHRRVENELSIVLGSRNNSVSKRSKV